MKCKQWSSPLLWLGFTGLGIALLASFGPAEKSLGSNVRLVYLHGAWVWAALISLAAAAGSGLMGLLTRHYAWQVARW